MYIYIYMCLCVYIYIYMHLRVVSRWGRETSTSVAKTMSTLPAESFSRVDVEIRNGTSVCDIYLSIYIYIYTHMSICICVYAYAHTYIHIHTYMYVYIYIYTYAAVIIETLQLQTRQCRHCSIPVGRFVVIRIPARVATVGNTNPVGAA